MNQSNLPDANPYASPQVDSTPNELPYFGLIEPICVEGVKTVDDMIRANRAIQDKSPWRRHVVFMGWIVFLSSVPLLYVTLWLPGGFLLNIAVAVLAVALYSIVMFVLVPRRKRRQLEKALGAGKSERFCFAEAGLSIHSETGSGEHMWERFWCYRVAEELLLLRLQGFSEVLVIPRSFCPSEARWQTVLELVACKMPLWERGKQPALRKIEPLAAPATVLDDEPGAANAIEAAGQYSPAQLRYASRVAHPLWPLRYLYLIALLGGFGIWSIMQWVEDQSWQSFITVGLIATILSVRFLVSRRQAHVAWKEKRGPYEWQNWLISPEQLKVSTPTSKQTMQWNMFARVIQRKQMVLLLLENRTFFLLPRSFFASAADWERFVEIVTQQCES